LQMRRGWTLALGPVVAACATALPPVDTPPLTYEGKDVEAVTLTFRRRSPTPDETWEAGYEESEGYSGMWPGDFCPGPPRLTPTGAIDNVKHAFRACLEAAFPEAAPKDAGVGKENGGVTFHIHAKVENGVVVETTATDVYPPSAIDCVEEAFDTAHFASEGNVAMVIPMRLIWKE
jgi:hypothetical protein